MLVAVRARCDSRVRRALATRECTCAVGTLSTPIGVTKQLSYEYYHSSAVVSQSSIHKARTGLQVGESRGSYDTKNTIVRDFFWESQGPTFIILIVVLDFFWESQGAAFNIQTILLNTMMIIFHHINIYTGINIKYELLQSIHNSFNSSHTWSFVVQS